MDYPRLFAKANKINDNIINNNNNNIDNNIKLILRTFHTNMFICAIQIMKTGYKRMK